MSRGSCVVLGGSGFLGKSLCRRLVQEGFRVASISRSGRPSDTYEPWHANVDWITAPLGSEKCLRVLEGCEFLFHLASSTVPSTSNANILFDLDTNVLATVRTLEAAVKHSLRRIVFVSSGGTVYGVPQRNPIDELHPTNPICSYGVQKLTIEKYLHLFNSMADLSSVILRVSNIYGESQSPKGPVGAVAHFTHKALLGKPIEIWGDGSIIRDYVHIDDVVSALMKSMTYQGVDPLFNIGTGRGVSIKELIQMIQSRIERPIRFSYEPSRVFDVRENVLDVNRARRKLEWEACITLEMGLDRMIGVQESD